MTFKPHFLSNVPLSASLKVNSHWRFALSNSRLGSATGAETLANPHHHCGEGEFDKRRRGSGGGTLSREKVGEGQR